MSAHSGGAAILIHGGAGTIGAEDAHPDTTAAYRAALDTVLREGQRLLAGGGSALDAVTLAVALLEDCPLFNAGHGAVFTSEETHELDAAIMDGATLRAGAIACASRVRNPVRAARALLEYGGPVLLVGRGAEAFAASQGLAMVAPEHFSTDARRAQWRKARESAGMRLDHDDPAAPSEPNAGLAAPLDESRKFGTVGAVALDAQGDLAAATSTGGMVNKHPGRVGDSPLIGAGTYADNRSAAVSCTGAGEYFVRAAVAHDVCARMRYARQTLESAADEIVLRTLPALGGRGGLIAIDAQGNFCAPFNTEGMYRGHARVGGALHTAIFR